MKLLLIEDEQALMESMAAYLEKEGYLCETAPDYQMALDKIDLYDYDCILLDISLPDGNGLELLQELKDNQKLDGVIIISARDALDDKIKGLQLGADDYLPKPFHLSELSARIAAVIRRRQFDGNNQLKVGEIIIDFPAKTALINDQILTLTKKEYDLLVFFMVNKNRVLSRNAIAVHLSGDDADWSDNFDFIYAHIKNLKKKLGAAGCKDYIQSIYGIGYKFSA